MTFHRNGMTMLPIWERGRHGKKRQKCPFDIFGTPLVLQAMPPHFDLDIEPEVKIPVWLRLVDLPVDLWNLTTVSKIASYMN